MKPTQNDNIKVANAGTKKEEANQTGKLVDDRSSQPQQKYLVDLITLRRIGPTGDSITKPQRIVDNTICPRHERLTALCSVKWRPDIAQTRSRYQ